MVVLSVGGFGQGTVEVGDMLGRIGGFGNPLHSRFHGNPEN